ncbi:MAG: NAD(P)-dependent oxidoreductase [Anaerolineae bacterium]|nr:NAD(P)-dependent oxidoreductase [Anaerolineae bacterium]
MSNRTFLVTGAMGCIGAWTLYHLVKMGENVVSFDLQTSGHRVDLLLNDDDKKKVNFVGGDLTNTEQVANAFKEHGITHVIHLAALQVPFCRANPVLGAQVNVTGTVNVFEAARYNNVKHIAFASSVAVYGPADMYPAGLLKNDIAYGPTTLYGVYKVADEGMARIYWAEQGISSTYLRPFTVYGVGRDQGVTSDPTKAMLAAMAGQPFHINFGGKQQLQFASDVAQQFIDAAVKPRDGAYGYNLGGEPVAIAHVVDIIKQIKPDAQITMNETPMSLPEGFDDSALRAEYQVYETPVEEGIRATMEAFGSHLAAGRIKV